MKLKYDIQILRHSKEEKDQLKSFINLDNHHIGIEFDDDFKRCRYFLYKDKKKHADQYSDWVKMSGTRDELSLPLFAMVQKYYAEHSRLVDGDLPLYTKIELMIPVTHLYYHINAGTLNRVLEKEIIYF